jgi:hypothetical protein
MREPAEWPQLDLGEGVRLLLGWRSGRRGMEARPVNLATSVGEEMIAAARETLERIGGSERRIYSGVPGLDLQQYLALPLTEEQAQNEEALSEAGAALGEDAAAASQLIQLVRNAFENDDFLSKDELRRGRWLFYAVVVELVDEERPIGFVRQYNPQRGIRAGRLLTAYSDTLTRFTDPVFNFDLDFDLVIAPDEIAALSTTAFDRLFADLSLAAVQVPDQVTQLNAALGVNLSAGGAQFLGETVQSRAALVQRLRRVAQAGHLGAVTYTTMGDALDKHALPRDRFGPGPDLDLQTADDVHVFLDMLEELYFETDFTVEHRRADRYSRRQP